MSQGYPCALPFSRLAPGEHRGKTYRFDTSSCYAPSMLELALLGLLKERPMHGYDLRKRIRENFGPLGNLSFGSLYPALARLETAGAVRALPSSAGEVERTQPPMTGSLAGERAAF